MWTLIIVLQSLSFSHDIAIGNFEVSQEGGKLKLLAKLDKEDLETLASYQSKEVSKMQTNIDFVQVYLDKHFRLGINGQMVQFNVEKLSDDREYYTIELVSEGTFDQRISEVTLQNTCLLDYVEKQSNIVHFSINEKTRSFRLHKERTKITVNY